MRASNEGYFHSHPLALEAPRRRMFPLAAQALILVRPPSSIRIDQMGGHSLVRIVRAHSDRARTASMSVQPSGLCHLSSLPPGHFVSFLLQAPIDVIRVGLAGLVGRAGHS